jgi:hypothetical protein
MACCWYLTNRELVGMVSGQICQCRLFQIPQANGKLEPAALTKEKQDNFD